MRCRPPPSPRRPDHKLGPSSRHNKPRDALTQTRPPIRPDCPLAEPRSSVAAGARLLAEDDNVGDATNKLLLDLDETAAMLGLKRQTLARMSRRGLIPRVKLGRLVKYPVSLIGPALEKLAEQQAKDEA